jgi:hypothetical protein
LANNILMVSMIDGKTHLLNLKRHVKSYQLADQPIFDADLSTLEEKCKKAREIYVNSDFPSANYFWGRFPKVGRRYIKEIVVREARQQFGYVGPVRATFQDVGQTFEGGTAKRLLACAVVDNTEVFPIENEIFGRFKHKISHINSLSTALCAVVAQVERPSGDFMVISIGDSSTTMAISSRRGDVKVSRQIPIGFGDKDDCNDAVRCQNFFNEIAKDVTNTNLYYLQNFQGSECSAYYMLGSPSVQLALEQHGDEGILPGVQFGLSRSPLSSIDNKQASAWAYMFGSLYCHRNYNFLSPKIVLQRNFNQGYRFAMTAIVAAIVGCGLYLYQIDPVGADKISKYRIKNAKLATTQNEVLDLKNQVNTLNQFSGWKTFYRNTYKDQPAWNTMFTEMAHHLPKEIVIDSFRIDSGAGKGIRAWKVLFTGHIKVPEWDRGLELLRDFGAKIHSSPNFRIVNVRYTPAMDEDNRPTEEISFDFQINAQLTSQDTK